MDAFYSLVFGMVLGFSLTIPPGPMNALIASETVTSVRKGIVAGTGAMSADLVLGVVVYLVRSALDIGSYISAVYALGTVVVAYLGVTILRNRKKQAVAVHDRRTYARAFVTGISNPFQILWWLTAGLAFAYLGGFLLFIGLFVAIAAWIVMFPLALHAGTGRHRGASEAVAVASAIVMFAFALYFAYLAAVSV